MMKSESESYKAAGVDITAGYASVELMKKHVARTMTAGCVEGIGGFGGLFALDAAGMEEPVLVSGTDGVGTKLKIAMLLDKHDTIGIDCVAMCVNDVICCGAKPLFFLDYIACGKNVPEKIASIVAGVAEGCVQAESALIGGETAEHPGMMPEDDYDLAGFSVGIVDKKRIINRETVRPGDVMLALPSTGVHSNGFSLVRKVFSIGNGGENRNYPELDKSLWETLLTPTKIYVKALMPLFEANLVRGVAHITGGGFIENVPRMLPEGLAASIELGSWPVPPIFDVIEKAGDVDHMEMYNIFNMGLGMVVAIRPDRVDEAMNLLEHAGEKAYRVGHVIEQVNERVDLA